MASHLGGVPPGVPGQALTAPQGIPSSGPPRTHPSLRRPGEGIKTLNTEGNGGRCPGAPRPGAAPTVPICGHLNFCRAKAPVLCAEGGPGPTGPSRGEAYTEGPLLFPFPRQGQSRPRGQVACPDAQGSVSGGWGLNPGCLLQSLCLPTGCVTQLLDTHTHTHTVSAPPQIQGPSTHLLGPPGASISHLPVVWLSVPWGSPLPVSTPCLGLSCFH